MPRRFRTLERYNCAHAQHVHLPFDGVEECVVLEVHGELMLRSLKVLPLWQGKGVGGCVLTELKRRGKPIRVIPFPSDPDRYMDLVRFYQYHRFEPQEDDTFLWRP